MNRKSHSVFVVLGLALASIFSGSIGPAANHAPSPYYADTTSQILWFIQTSDLHIGAGGSQPKNNLLWLVTTAKNAIAPSFTIITGDITDSTNGNFLGIPNGPYQSEWDAYRSVVDTRVSTLDFYDMPGNHEEYNDGDFSYYLANAVQGRETGHTQLSFTRTINGAKYHFLGINTADNSGKPFSLSSPYGDYAGLDSTELSFITTEMAANTDAALMLVFGHHPLAPTGDSTDTYVYYGLTDFLKLMNANYGVLYGYGHTHAYGEAFFNPGLSQPGFFYLDVASLGKSSANQYTVFAIDCNGISSVTPTVGKWPVALITAPVDRYYGNTTSPYRYDVTASTASPIRALAFDPVGISRVEYRIDGSATWSPMANVAANPKLWSVLWNSSALPQGNHTIEVRATNTSGATNSNTITVGILQTQPPPQPKIGASQVITGQYTGKPLTFKSGNTFVQGATIVFQATLASGTTPMPGAVATVAISGPKSVTLTTGTSNSLGIAEAKWVTTAPTKRGSGTPISSYTATVTGVTLSGCVWDGAKPSVGFSVTK